MRPWVYPLFRASCAVALAVVVAPLLISFGCQTSTRPDPCERQGCTGEVGECCPIEAYDVTEMCACDRSCLIDGIAAGPSCGPCPLLDDVTCELQHLGFDWLAPHQTWTIPLGQWAPTILDDRRSNDDLVIAFVNDPQPNIDPNDLVVLLNGQPETTCVRVPEQEGAYATVECDDILGWVHTIELRHDVDGVNQEVIAQLWDRENFEVRRANCPVPEYY